MCCSPNEKALRPATDNTLEYKPALCINCGMCTEVCPRGVFAKGGSCVELQHPESCIECGACMVNCPTGAIDVDSGVGCAVAMMRAALLGRREPSCGPSRCSGSEQRDP